MIYVSRSVGHWSPPNDKMTAAHFQYERNVYKEGDEPGILKAQTSTRSGSPIAIFRKCFTKAGGTTAP